MGKKKFILKLLLIVAVVSSAFIFSSCFTTLGLLSCKKSCQQSCNSCGGGESISGHETGIYYELSYDEESYLVSEIGYNETSVIIPESYDGKPVTGIKRGAMTHYSYSSGCGGSSRFDLSLSSLTLPSTIKTVDYGVFAQTYYYRGRGADSYYSDGGTCRKLVFKGTLEDWFGIDFGSTPLICCSDFYIAGERVSEVTVPEGVTKINANAFAYYDGLESVNLHENVAVIENDAFFNCRNLANVTFPCAKLTIGSNAFAECYSLKKITFTGEELVLGDGAFSSCQALKEVEWNTVHITIIPYTAFYCCDGLESFVIPSSVEIIRDDAFTGCTNIVEVINLSKLNVVAGASTHGRVAYYAGVVHTAEEDDSYIITEGEYKFAVSEAGCTLFKYTGNSAALNLRAPEGVESFTIRANTFADNDLIQSVNIPACVTEIGEGAFYSCSNLQVVSGCEGLSSVGKSAFSWCNNLESVALGKVEEIGAEAFSACFKLESVSIGSVKKIGKRAFSNCLALKTLALPLSLTEIGESAFEECTVELTYEGALDEWSEVKRVKEGLYTVKVTCADGVWEGGI